MTLRRRRIDRGLKDLRERKYRLRSRTSKFIPDADRDFAHMARDFVTDIARAADRLPLSAEQVSNLTRAVAEFREALSKTFTRRTRGPFATSIKNSAREKAERVIRAAARIIRADESVSNVDRTTLNLHERPKKLKERKCPDVAPVVRYIRSTDPDGSGPSWGGGGCKHILEYGNDFDHASGAKPHGAVRLELFVELVPPELAATGKVPTHPGQLSGGRLWYLRSFTNSRMEVEFPVLVGGTPMLVVYWGRWANTKGEVGRFSKTCVARVEGWSAIPHNALPAGNESQRIETKFVVLQAPYQLPDQSLNIEAVNMVETRLLPALGCVR